MNFIYCYKSVLFIFNSCLAGRLALSLLLDQKESKDQERKMLPLALELFENSKQKTCPFWATFEEYYKEINSPHRWPAFLSRPSHRHILPLRKTRILKVKDKKSLF